MLKLGKLPPPILEDLLNRIPHQDPSVLVWPAVGEDSAVLEVGNSLVVVTTDPITFATEEIGWYAVHINANDVAVKGAKPRWFLASLLLPEGVNKALISGIFDQILETCQDLSISLIGGHTEVTPGLSRPIVAGMMLGEVKEGELVKNDARPGDTLLLAQPIAVEGTALLAREAEEALQRAGVERSLILQAKELLKNPGISVVRAVETALKVGGVRALHDPTEGGLATGLRELGAVCKAGIWVDYDAIPLLPETRILCQALGLDPLGLLASGSLIMAVEPEKAEAICQAEEEAGIPTSAIGHLLPERDTFLLLKEGESIPLPVFAQDEVARFFESFG